MKKAFQNHLMNPIINRLQLVRIFTIIFITSIFTIVVNLFFIVSYIFFPFDETFFQICNIVVIPLLLLIFLGVPFDVEVCIVSLDKRLGLNGALVTYHDLYRKGISDDVILMISQVVSDNIEGIKSAISGKLTFTRFIIILVAVFFIALHGRILDKLERIRIYPTGIISNKAYLEKLSEFLKVVPAEEKEVIVSRINASFSVGDEEDDKESLAKYKREIESKRGTYSEYLNSIANILGLKISLNTQEATAAVVNFINEQLTYPNFLRHSEQFLELTRRFKANSSFFNKIAEGLRNNDFVAFKREIKFIIESVKTDKILHGNSHTNNAQKRRLNRGPIGEEGKNTDVELSDFRSEANRLLPKKETFKKRIFLYARNFTLTKYEKILRNYFSAEDGKGTR